MTKNRKNNNITNLFYTTTERVLFENNVKINTQAQQTRNRAKSNETIGSIKNRSGLDSDPDRVCLNEVPENYSEW